MITKLYVGNLPFSTTEDEVADFFAEYGDVYSVNLIADRETGRPRGFGFVEVDLEDAATTIQELDGIDFDGRNLRVNKAEDRGGGGGNRRGGGGGGGFNRGGGGGGGGRGRY